MSSPISNWLIQAGFFLSGQARPSAVFQPDCVMGDTLSYAPPVAFFQPYLQAPQVILTANDLDISITPPHSAAAVGMARQVTNTGFTPFARNSDCVFGQAGINWLAVGLLPPQRQPLPVDLRLGARQPQHFQPDCVTGDTLTDLVTFSSALTPPGGLAAVQVFLTATDLNVVPFVTGTGSSVYHVAATVGVVQNLTLAGFTLHARNSDCAEGSTNHYYVAVALDTVVPNSPFIVDAGKLGPLNFTADCTPGDTQSQAVFFSSPFSAPPIVLVTANDDHIPASTHNAAVVCTARQVTPYGFTLVGRNSDCVGGLASFHWVAFGCGQGCG
jgi:hypothetical protein